MVVKAVFSQGRPLREGSVVPDFDDPRYEQRPIPPVPVPSWPEASSNSGKRRAQDHDGRFFGANDSPNVKRQRLNDLDDTDSEDGVALSVERDGQLQAADAVLPTSQTVIHDSQSSPGDEPVKSIRQSLAPGDGMISFQPSYAGTSRRALSPIDRLKADLTSESFADLPLPVPRKHLLYGPQHGKTQELLTPPSDASKKTASGETKTFHVHGSKRKFSPAQAISSELRRPSTSQKNPLDMNESEEIECSLMSPNSKLATSKKLSRSSSGSRSFRGRKERYTPATFKGTVSNSEVIKLMEDGSIIQSESSKRPRKEIPYDMPGDCVSDVQSRKHLASPFPGLSLPKNNGWPKTLSRQNSVDVDITDHEAGPFAAKAILEERDDSSEESASVAAEDTSVLERNSSILSTHSSTAHATKQVTNSQTTSGRRRTRKRKYQINDDDAIKLLNIDTARPQLDTKQSTPMDSPGEQLLEMQASSQKPRANSRTRESKAEIQARTKGDKEKTSEQEEVVGPTTALAVSSTRKRQGLALDEKVTNVEVSPTIVSKATEAPTRSDTASKSSYARPSPPEGSIGLGFTDSPRRHSTLSASSASLGLQNISKNKPAHAEVGKSDALEDSESSSNGADDSTDSTVATPSKPARPEKVQTTHQKANGKPKPTAELQTQMREATAKSKLTSKPLLRSESPAVVIVPKGMTLEQYEAIKNKFKDAPPKKKGPVDPKVKRHLQAQAELALARTSSKESNSSVAPSEQLRSNSKKEAAAKEEPVEQKDVAVTTFGEPKLGKKRASKKMAAENEELAAVSGSTTAKQANTKPERIVEKKQKKVVQQAVKATSTPSSTASNSKVSESVPAKTMSGTAAPSVTVPASNLPQPGSLLKNLKHRVADKSARSSPAPPTFAPASKPVTKKFDTLDEDSDEESSSDDGDDIEEKRAKVVTAAKPDQSTRSTAVDSNEDTDEDSDEDED